MFTIHVVKTYRLSERVHEQLSRVERMQASIIREIRTMITPQIQDALDRIRQTQSLVHSVKQASDLQTAKIGELTAKVTELQAKVDAGGAITSDDLSAVAEIASDADQINAELQSAIPANTGPGPADAPPSAPAAPPPSDAPPSAAPDLSNDSQHAADAAAAAAAKPLGS